MKRKIINALQVAGFVVGSAALLVGCMAVAGGPAA